MTNALDKLANDRAEALKRESAALTGAADGFLVFARENCSFVALLSLMWQMTLLRLRQGGAPAKFVFQECDSLLTLLAAPQHYLALMTRVWQERRLPAEVADAIHADVQNARSHLELLTQQVQAMRTQLAEPRELSADPEELKRRVKRADEERAWVPLKEAVAKMRSGGPS
jgi:hypothetical protein